MSSEAKGGKDFGEGAIIYAYARGRGRFRVARCFGVAHVPVNDLLHLLPVRVRK